MMRIQCYKNVFRQTLFVMSLMVLTGRVWSIDSEKNGDSKNGVLIDKDGKRFITAVRTEHKPDIDGYLNDPAWETAQFQEHFTQREPEEGTPATEKTEVGVLYDEQNLYFGLKCYDSEPDKIIAREMRRDARMNDDDFFALILDTYHDHRSGYYFVTNPNGAKRDAVIANEGRDFNSAWEGVWWCKARITTDGWFAEIAIPWKTLRFNVEDSAVWGINFARMVRRKNEHVFWQLIPRDFGYFGLFRLSEAGTLHGMTDLRMGGNLELRPYFLGGLENDLNTDFATDRMNDTGVDARVALTPNLALDLTVNTDFAQVEADQEQVNLTRFSLYYPEKREFFLEGAEVFSFGGSGRRYWHGRGADLNLFYSRRLGLVNGLETPILGGAKMVGKIGRYQVGVMNILTDKVTIEEDDETTKVSSANFSVLRMRRDILKRGTIGLMLLNKEEIHSSGYNRSMGLDINLPLTDYFTISGYFAGTFGPNEEEDGKIINMNKQNLAGKLSLRYDSDLWEFSASYQDVGAQFNPEMGFIRRTDYRLNKASVEFSPRPKKSPVIRQFTYKLEGNYRTDHSNRMLDSAINASFGIRFQNSARFTIGVKRENEFIDEDWEVREGFLIPIGTYSGYESYIRTNSDESRTVAGRINLNYGNYYTGRNMRFGFGGSVTNITPLRIEIDYNHNFVDLPEGSFRTNTLGLRMFYFFSTELYFKAYVQWNDDRLNYDGKEKIIANFLLRWIYSPTSNLYLVYNDGRLIGPGNDEISNRTFMLKATFFWRK
ncbi:MAG: DUF5916 domain-containing protein [bacterium]